MYENKNMQRPLLSRVNIIMEGGMQQIISIINKLQRILKCYKRYGEKKGEWRIGCIIK